MEPETTSLEDVVVIGYGTVKKRDLTGAVTTMKNEDVVIAPTTMSWKPFKVRLPVWI